ncbi:MAG: aminoglycoside phosphotransferase family protein [Oscillospiraceae bacterium]|nr:aminoglycoside phosphotransferase family protein [Oscillospiraceae bacterium]
MNDNNNILETFNRHIPATILSVKRMESEAMNTVYRIDTKDGAFIFKKYTSGWPEIGKVPYVEAQLTEYGIPHAELIVYHRDENDYINSYLIERFLPGTSADKLAMTMNDERAMYAKLGGLMSRVHTIPLTGYGYIGASEACCKTFSEFTGWDDVNDKLRETVYPESALNALMLKFEEALKPCDIIPSTICHIDLAKKNIIIDDNNLTLVDWDCAYALPWVCEIARLKVLMRQSYPQDTADELLQIFIDNYTPPQGDMEIYLTNENALYAWFALMSVNSVVGKPDFDQQLHEFQVVLATWGWELQ